MVVSRPPNWKDWREVGISILMISCSPIQIYIQYLKLAYLELKLKLKPNDNSLILAKENFKRILNTHIKLELGLETIYQLVGQLILLFMAYTETPTKNGLRSLFNDGLSARPIFFLITSICLSLYSCVASHWKALNICREFFPFKSRLISGLYCLLGCLTRVTAIIMFFAGPLGLFSLLRHLQGEQYPWNPYILQSVNEENGMMTLGGTTFKWDKIDRWKKDEKGPFILNFIGRSIPNPNHLISAPDYTLYVGISLREYLIVFFAAVGIHVIVIYVAKTCLCKSLWNKLNFLERIIHCLENTNIAYNIKEWDDGKGDAKEHIKRKQANWKEVLAIIIINGVFNILLLMSLCYLGMDGIIDKEFYFNDLINFYSDQNARTTHSSI